jgi:hypothetical protein
MEKPIRWTYANFYENWSTCKNESMNETLTELSIQF